MGQPTGSSKSARKELMKTTALYPGSFDPITLGHVDLIERASQVFGNLVVGVAIDNAGKSPLFTVDARVDLIREAVGHLDNVIIEPFSGLLVDYARRSKVEVLVRGLRAFSDFEYEFQMALMNRKMSPELETLFLMPKDEYSYISSSLVRQVAGLGGDVSGFVPANVAEALAKRRSSS